MKQSVAFETQVTLVTPYVCCSVPAPVTEAACFSDGTAPAVLFMVFIIIILLLVVVALAIALVLVGRKFRQLRKKTLNISTQGGHHMHTTLASLIQFTLKMLEWLGTDMANPLKLH